MESKTDEELAKMAQGYNKDAYCVLVERYEKKLLRYGRRFLFNHSNLEDVVQEVFIKAYININSFDVRRKFSSWIYRIAHNEFVNVIGKTKKQPLLLFDADTIFSFGSKDNILKTIITEEEKAELEDSLSELKRKYQEVVILYYFEDKDYKEIADILKIPISTVGVRLQRGRKEIKKIYEKKEKKH